ncbi:MAG: NAD-dependent epimerase/dehydratase family protein [Litoreibacter sp.]
MLSNSDINLAVTGATGFIGRSLLAKCATHNITVSALTRTPQPAMAGVRWVVGDLFDADALAELVDGATSLIHLAGATKARRRSDFHKINTQATESLAEICEAKGVSQFIFLSSLAASRPDASPYAKSKADAEAALSGVTGAMQISMIRAPAVLGPGDSATHPLFSGLSRGMLVIPNIARDMRFSIIDVEDLNALILSLTTQTTSAKTLIEPYGHESLEWSQIADAASRVMDQPVRRIYLPSLITQLVAKAVDAFAIVSGKTQTFSSDKLGELKAGDWIATDPIATPISLDETIRRCITPFSESKLVVA